MLTGTTNTRGYFCSVLFVAIVFFHIFRVKNPKSKTEKRMKKKYLKHIMLRIYWFWNWVASYHYMLYFVPAFFERLSINKTLFGVLVELAANQHWHIPRKSFKISKLKTRRFFFPVSRRRRSSTLKKSFTKTSDFELSCQGVFI